MKQFIIRLAAMAAMTAAIVACDKENLDPSPDNGRNESIVEPVSYTHLAKSKSSITCCPRISWILLCIVVNSFIGLCRE